MKTLKSLVAVAFIAATLFTVSNALADHGGGRSHGGYDCQTDTFRK